MTASCRAEDNPGPIPCTEPRPGCPSLDECTSGGCYETLYGCDTSTGEWVEEGTCEPLYVSVVGTLEILQSVETTTGTCPALVPRSPLVLEIDDEGTVTAAPPTAIVEAVAVSGSYSGTVDVTLTDDWSGETATVIYSFVIGSGSEASGEAHAVLDDCEVDLVLDVAFSPP